MDQCQNVYGNGEIQAKLKWKKKDLPLEEQIPKEFHDFLDIFSEEKVARFPES